MKRRSLILATLMSTAVAFSTSAAVVPEGTNLAENQVFTYCGLDEFSSFDQQVVEDVNSSEVARDLFEGLYNQDADGNNVPGVALSHEVSDDNMTYTLKLRDNAKWSDGTPVTAGDFVYAWQRAVDPKLASPYAWYVELMSVHDRQTKAAAMLERVGIARRNFGRYAHEFSGGQGFVAQIVTTKDSLSESSMLAEAYEQLDTYGV